MDLRRLDDRAVARAAAWARGVRVAAAAAPGPSALLRALDDRYASTGVLRVVRDAPVIGVLAAATVLLAGTGTSAALALTSSERGRAVPAQATVLGAPVGVDAEAHLAAAQERAVALARETPGTRYLALVSLRDELTVPQAVRLLVESQLALRRAYVRAPVDGEPQLFAVDLAQDPGRTLTAFWSATAQRKTEEQRELTALAASAATPEARTAHEAAARTAGAEAAAYAAGCACILALVVEGPAGELAELPSLPAVRGVEVAPRGTRLDTVQVAPLPGAR